MYCTVPYCSEKYGRMNEQTDESFIEAARARRLKMTEERRKGRTIENSGYYHDNQDLFSAQKKEGDNKEIEEENTKRRRVEVSYLQREIEEENTKRRRVEVSYLQRDRGGEYKEKES